MQPLAARLRPNQLAAFYGQQHLLAEGKPLYVAMQQGLLHSMILWGPPGCGKTTLARLLAQAADAEVHNLSAVLSGVKEIRAAVADAQAARARGMATVLFVDEVHRFNKSQQDAFLPFVEDGTLTFIGATTENPSFALNNALLSRTRVYVLNGLKTEDLLAVIQAAVDDFGRQYKADIVFPLALRQQLVEFADGDARRVLNLVEIAFSLAQAEQENFCITDDLLKQVLTDDVRRFDRGGDIFYDQISALHKAVRGSAPDAALYWLARMLDGGCDPLYIARRVLRMASEDVGNADPRALQLALDAWETLERLGSPEGELALAQAVTYLACAAKSNAVYNAFKAAQQAVSQQGSLDVPLHLRNAPTALMRELDYGKQYRYAHDEPHAYAAGEQYFPDAMGKPQYYVPSDRGLEKKIAAKLDFLRQLDEAAN